MIKFILDQKSGIPFYRQVIDQIRFGIASGNLSVGEQLPTVRALAVELKVNLNTIAKAYKELEIQNILETQQGTGTFISSADSKLFETERKLKLQSIIRDFTTITYSYGFTIDELIDELKNQKK
ncbi:MAG TPA: GntR family transcriptional regulator [Prolixibacteraceae bacterium]|nr:GntR family transcriptional regulator [Prolixibacteraceae bacterium]